MKIDLEPSQLLKSTKQQLHVFGPFKIIHKNNSIISVLKDRKSLMYQMQNNHSSSWNKDSQHSFLCVFIYQARARFTY